MIKVINIESKNRTPVAEGHVRNILGPSDDGHQGSGRDRGS